MSVKKQKTILLVEDETITEIITSKAIGKLGYNVVTANSGEKAIEIALSNKNISLILMDIDLGKGIDGTQTAELILKDVNIPVVFLSSHTETDVVEKTEKITSYGYVVKNSSNTVLDASIKMAFKLFDANEKLRNELAERKIASEALKESEERYRSIMNNITDGYFELDLAGNLTFCNPSFARMLKYPEAELLGMNNRQVMDAENAKMTFKKFNEVFRTGISVENFIWEFICRDGSLLIADSGIHLLYNKQNEKTGFWGLFRDITERKQAQDDILQEQLFSKSIIESLPNMFFLYSYPECRLIRWNRRHETELGYTADELNGRSVMDFHAPENRELTMEAINTVMEKGSLSIEDLLIAKDGRRIPFFNSIVRHELKGRSYFMGVCENITERKRTGRALLESEQKYRRLINNIQDLIYEIDSNGVLMYISPSVKEIMDYDPGEMIGKNFIDFIYVKDRSFLLKRFSVLSDGLQLPLEHRIVKKSGEAIWVRTRTTPIYKDGVLSGADGLLIDISERKQVEEALQQANNVLHNSQMLFERTISMISDNVWNFEVNAAGEFVRSYISPVADRLLGLPAGTIGNDPKKFFAYIHPEDLPYTMEALYSGLRQHKKNQKLEYRLIKPDGLVIWVLTKASAYPEESGNVNGYGITADITEQKRIEEEIRSLLSGKEMILREVNHRIKNNMNTIYGLLMLQSDAMDDPSAAAALEDAAMRVQSMMVLYDKLYRSADFQKISVLDYLPDLADEIAAGFPDGKSIRIEKKIDDFVLDAKRLQPVGIIINELLTNIMKYAFTGRKNGLITIEAHLLGDSAQGPGMNTGSEKPGTADTGRRVSIIIQDNGIGMPETFDFEHSTGFGLQLVWMLVKELKGSIRIERINGTKIIMEFEI